MSDLIRNTQPEAENSIVLFTAPSWCAPCRQFGPVFERAAKEHDGPIKFYYIDIDQNPEIASGFDITSVPTVIRIKNGEHDEIRERSPLRFLNHVNSME